MPDPYALLPGEVVPDGGARLKALFAVAGLPSLQALADELAIDGLGHETLRDIVRPSRARQLHYYEAVRIAEHFGIHPSFFTAPVRHLGGVGEPGRMPYRPRRRS